MMWEGDHPPNIGQPWVSFSECSSSHVSYGRRPRKGLRDKVRDNRKGIDNRDKGTGEREKG